MKAIKFKLIAILLLVFSFSQAQVSINVNFGTPPVWAPAERVETQYYYLPDIDCYYDVPSAMFIYIKNGKWFRSASLPYRYRNYNLRGGQVIYLTDYRGNSPYIYHNKHREKYHRTVFVKPRKPESPRNHGNEENHGNNHKKGKKHRD
jgi:hypothetical protein